MPGSSLHLVPNEGHIHLYLDGTLVQMIGGLHAIVTASPGTHTLRAEFVALDHGPFRPPGGRGGDVPGRGVNGYSDTSMRTLPTTFASTAACASAVRSRGNR